MQLKDKSKCLSEGTLRTFLLSEDNNLNYLSDIVINNCQAGGLDSLTLNSLYDEAAYRASQQPVYGTAAPNPFEVQDPFAVSNSISPPTVVQMAAMGQQQHNPFGSYQPTYPQQQQQQLMMSPSNPFGDAGLGAFPANQMVPFGQPHGNNPFGRSTGLL